MENWYGALVPAATPPDVVAKLEAAVMDVLKTPAVWEKISANGVYGPQDAKAFRAQIVNELGIDTEDAEGDELVAVKIGEMLAFHLLCELGTDVLYRHRELLLLIHIKPERLHLSRVVRISLKVEQSRAFTVVEKALAIDLARIARDGEVNILPA